MANAQQVHTLQEGQQPLSQVLSTRHMLKTPHDAIFDATDKICPLLLI
jgi:hypothetical protein